MKVIWTELAKAQLIVAAFGYRYLVSGNYKIIYRIVKEEKVILIASVFDTRQHPDSLEV